MQGQFAQANMIQRVENVTFGGINKVVRAADDAKTTVM